MEGIERFNHNVEGKENENWTDVYDKIFVIEDMPVEEFRRELEVNVIARRMCIKYAIQLLKNLIWLEL